MLKSPQGAALTGRRASLNRNIREGLERAEQVGANIEGLRDDLEDRLDMVEACVEDALKERPKSAPAARPRFRTVRHVVRGEHVAKRTTPAGQRVEYATPMRTGLQSIPEPIPETATASEASSLTPDDARARSRRRGAERGGTGAPGQGHHHHHYANPIDEARVEPRRGAATANRWRPEHPPSFGSFYAAGDGPPVGTYAVTYKVAHVQTARDYRGGISDKGAMRLRYPTGKAAPVYTITARNNTYGHSRTHSNWMMKAIAHASSLPGPGAYHIPSTVEGKHTRNRYARPGGAGTLSRSGRF